jgi:GNAT superfamily N-acetyltransferase
MSFRIRRSIPSESPELTRIAHASKRHWGYSDDLMTMWQADLTVSPAAIADDLVFCAEVDGAIAAFYAVSGDGPVREIEHLWVLPAHIGTGVGRALFEHMVEQLWGAGVSTLRIASDPNAAGFYERMGARRIGDVPATPEGRTLPLLELAIV